ATTAGNQLSLRHSEHIFSVQVDGTVADQPGWRVHQPHDRERSHTLAGAALADQTQAFSGTKMKGDILHRGCVLAVVRKAGLKPLYVQNGIWCSIFWAVAVPRHLCPRPRTHQGTGAQARV